MNADYCILSTRLLPLYDDLADGLGLSLRYSHEIDPARHELAVLIPRIPRDRHLPAPRAAGVTPLRRYWLRPCQVSQFCRVWMAANSTCHAVSCSCAFGANR